MLSNTVVTSHMWLLKTEMWVIHTESITEIHTRFQTPNSKEKKKKECRIFHTLCVILTIFRNDNILDIELNKNY